MINRLSFWRFIVGKQFLLLLSHRLHTISIFPERRRKSRSGCNIWKKYITFILAYVFTHTYAKQLSHFAHFKYKEEWSSDECDNAAALGKMLQDFHQTIFQMHVCCKCCY